jgi:hypothetical protein
MIDEKTREELNKCLPVFSVPEDEAGHFYHCRACGQLVDMRRLSAIDNVRCRAHWLLVGRLRSGSICKRISNHGSQGFFCTLTGAVVLRLQVVTDPLRRPFNHAENQVGGILVHGQAL